MNGNEILNNLEKRNNFLKSKLLHEQLKYGNYNFKYFNKHSQQILNEYLQTKSLFKSSLNTGINYTDVCKWFIQGQLGNPIFKDFYMAVTNINNIKNRDNDSNEPVEEIPVENPIDGEYEISQYGDGWSYKTFVDGEKIFIISDDLKKLKDKVKSKRLPLD